MRAIVVLEVIGGDTARRALEALAQGAQRRASRKPPRQRCGERFDSVPLAASRWQAATAEPHRANILIGYQRAIKQEGNDNEPSAGSDLGPAMGRRPRRAVCRP